MSKTVKTVEELIEVTKRKEASNEMIKLVLNSVKSHMEWYDPEEETGSLYLDALQQIAAKIGELL